MRQDLTVAFKAPGHVLFPASYLTHSNKKCPKQLTATLKAPKSVHTLCHVTHNKTQP